ncbi:hypothetical protein EDD18DRAFT_1326539 [Armillaria luteobubalina]|uniref:Uncharacterized protein n=1 Tax=Armillaria luteobubalina TaxID=153913 RepID=A0AA39QNB0_9AGAR|nr:hypothetical protein EDD18DRAFT_1326539 [Armillaria luteobubalina]
MPAKLPRAPTAAYSCATAEPAYKHYLPVLEELFTLHEFSLDYNPALKMVAFAPVEKSVVPPFGIAFYPSHPFDHCRFWAVLIGNNEHYFGIVEVLCPIDRHPSDADEVAVPDISDREFNCIINEVSRVKGHRTTAILDCCCSSSISREVPGPGARTSTRELTSDATVQATLIAGDHTMMGYPGYRPQSILAKDWSWNMDCRVLIAACKAHQFAYEEEVKMKMER